MIWKATWPGSRSWVTNKLGPKNERINSESWSRESMWSEIATDSHQLEYSWSHWFINGCHAHRSLLWRTKR